MAFPIIGGSQSGGYLIDNSLRFNDNDSAYLSRTPSSTGNRKTLSISFWTKFATPTNTMGIICVDNNSSVDRAIITMENSGKLSFFDRQSDSTNIYLSTTQYLRDVSAWYHILLAIDTTQATSSNRLKLYINGNQVTDFATANYGSQNYDTLFNLSSKVNVIGSQSIAGSKSNYFDGYLSEFNFIDGQALSPTDFGEFDEDSGIWKPIEYTGTFGTNGFYLDFENSGSLGADQSGNGNNFTPTNLASTDQTTDTPTNNFATLNVLSNNEVPNNNTFIYSEGNTEFTGSGSDTSLQMTVGNQGFNTGKWYWEIKCLVEGGNFPNVSIVNSDYNISGIQNNYAWLSPYGYSYLSGGSKNNNGGGASYGDSWSSGDIIGVAVDYDNGYIYFSKNGTWQNSGVPTSGASGTGSAYSINQSQTYLPAIGLRADGTAGKMSANFGNPSFSISSGNSDGNGYGNFEYAPPSGYLAICTQNLATALSPTIDDGSQYFNTKLYSGNNTTNPITGVGFAPDFTWLKARNYANAHFLLDTTRGSGQVLFSSSTTTETNFQGTRWQSFDSDGFTLTGSDSSTNISGGNYVTWNWKANAGSTSSNTDGSITSTVQANTTAGFSIVTYTGNSTEGATFGHGLGKAPKVVIIKGRTNSDNWTVYNGNLSVSKSLYLQTGDAERPVSPYNYWNLYWDETDPNSSVVTLGVDNSVNGNGHNFVAYCFADIEGYSKFGKYTGNGSTDGAFVYTGFRPAWLLVKKSDGVEPWQLRDTTREPFNVTDLRIDANSSNVEGGGTAGDQLDIFSNGFKCRSGAGQFNGNNTYIYLAFAENPFVTSGATPVTAR